MQENRLKKLPVELLMEICSHLPVENIGILGAVDKALHSTASVSGGLRGDEVWISQFQIHFPDIYLKLKNRWPPIPNNGWYEAFVTTYNEQYEPIKNKKIKQLFSRVKAGQDFSDLAITYDDLFVPDASGKTVIHWAREKNNQAALDIFYKKAIEKTKASVSSVQVPKSISYKIGDHELFYFPNTALEWAILLRQSEEEIKKLFAGDVYVWGFWKNFTIFALDGNLEALKYFIAHAKEKNCDFRFFFGFDYISAAIYNGHVDIVRYLLEQGVNPARRSPQLFVSGMTLLHLAAARGQLEIVKLLLEFEAVRDNLSATTGRNAQAIHFAAKSGHLAVVQYLIEQDENLIQAQTSFYQNPLHLAVKGGHRDVAAYLLAQIVAKKDDTQNILLEGRNGTPLGLAIQSNDLEMVKLLMPHVATTVNDKVLDGLTPLALAATKGNLAMVNYLLEQGADPEINFEPGRNPFYRAALHGHLDVAKFFHEKYPTLLQRSEPSELLMLVAGHGHINIVKYLLDQKVEYKKIQFSYASNEKYEKSPLYSVVENGRLEMIDVLFPQFIKQDNIDDLLSVASFRRKNTNEAEVIRKKLFSHYLNDEVKTTSDLIKKLQGLCPGNYQSLLSYCQSDRPALISKSTSLVCFFEQLLNYQFKTFFTAMVTLGICSIDEIIKVSKNFNAQNAQAANHLQANQRFIQNTVAPFTSVRQAIIALITELKNKGNETGMSTDRKQAINRLVSRLEQEIVEFFTNPSNERAKVLFDKSKILVESASKKINVPRTSALWRIMNQILLVFAHIFLFTIPIIWLHPASRNLLLDKTDAQVKAEAVLECIRKFHQFVDQGHFNSFFRPAEKPRPVEEPVNSASNDILPKVIN